MKPKSILLIFSLVCFCACNPASFEMPITTSSEEARQFFIEGREYYENMQREQSDSLFNLAIQKDSNFALAYLHQNQDIGLNDAYALSPKVSIAERLMIKASSSRYEGNFAESLSAVDSLLDLYPKDKHCLFFASQNYRAFNYNRALDLIQKAIKIDPNYAAAYNLYASQLMDLERYEEAEPIYIKYLDLWERTNLNTIDSYAEKLWKTGNFEDAIKAYRRILEINPTWTGSYYKMAGIYVHLEEYEKAKECCYQLFNSRPNDTGWVFEKARALNVLASIDFIQGDLPGAIETMDNFILLATSMDRIQSVVRAWLFKGWYAMRAGNFMDAIDYFTFGLNILSDTTLLINNGDVYAMRLNGALSITYGQMHDNDKAEFHLEKAKSIYNTINKHTYYRNLIKIYESALSINNGNFDNAISNLSPPDDYPFVYFYLAKAYELKGNEEMAIKYYAKVIQQFIPAMTGFFYNESKAKLKELSD